MKASILFRRKKKIVDFFPFVAFGYNHKVSKVLSRLFVPIDHIEYDVIILKHLPYNMASVSVCMWVRVCVRVP